jgi:hypothetical protein
MKKHKKLIQLTALVVLVSWQSILLVICVQDSLQQKHYVWLREDKMVCITDYTRYHAAGQMARSVDAAKIYIVPAHYAYINKLIAPFVIEHESAINFPPPTIALMSVMSLLPFRLAYQTFTFGSFFFAASAMFYFLFRTRAWSAIDSTIFCLAVGGSFSVFLTVQVGQWASILVAIYCIYFSSSLSKNEILAGIMLGILTIKPQYALPQVAIVVVQKRYLSLLCAGVTAVALNLWAVKLIGLQNCLSYPSVVSQLSRMKDVGSVGPAHASLRGLLSNIIESGLASDISTILLGIALFSFAILLWKFRRGIAQKQTFVFAVAVIIAMIFSPSSLNYDITLMCLPALLTLSTVNPLEALQLKSLALRYWHIVFMAYPLITWIFGIFIPKSFTYLYAFLNISLLIAAIFIFKTKGSELDSNTAHT